MTKVIVTGGSGKLGRAVLTDLVANGYEVLNIDQALPREPICPTVRIDLTNFGEVASAILGGVDERKGPFDAVVHLAAIPAPGLFANARTFANNVPATYNVFEAARLAGIKNVVFASSETVLGLPFDNPPPYVPVDEEYYPRPGERLFARQAGRRDDGAAVRALGPGAEDRRAAVLQRHGRRGLQGVPRLRRRPEASASGTSGATSTPATARRRCARRSRPSSRASRRSSSPTPTR